MLGSSALRAAAAEGGGPPSMQRRPSVVRAVATARAILNAEGVHEKTVEAAEFLVDHAWDVPRGNGTVPSVPGR